MAMASRNVDATPEPQALETLLGLSVGDVCFLQNVDATATLFLRLAAVEPAADMRAHKLFPGDSIDVSIDAAFRAWVWTDDPDGCAAIASAAI